MDVEVYAAERTTRHSIEEGPGMGATESSQANPRDTRTAYCVRCRRPRDFRHPSRRWAFHILLTILTFGLWLPVVLALLGGRLLRPWRCTACGWHHPECRSRFTSDVHQNEHTGQKDARERVDRRSLGWDWKPLISPSTLKHSRLAAGHVLCCDTK